jgi:hypothetical protein
MQTQGTGLYDTLNNTGPMRASEIVKNLIRAFG